MNMVSLTNAVACVVMEITSLTNDGMQMSLSAGKAPARQVSTNIYIYSNFVILSGEHLTPPGQIILLL